MSLTYGWEIIDTVVLVAIGNSCEVRANPLAKNGFRPLIYMHQLSNSSCQLSPTAMTINMRIDIRLYYYSYDRYEARF